MGLDPLFLANEGKMVVFCAEQDAEKILATMKSHEFGKDAAIIGNVSGKGRGRFVLQSAIGGSREIDKPSGELAPRICWSTTCCNFFINAQIPKGRVCFPLISMFLKSCM